MRYLSLGEVVDLHQALLDQSGGATGIRDLGGLENHRNELARIQSERSPTSSRR